jgi:hypothetical protein
MNCKDCSLVLEEYVDGALDEKQTPAVSLHLNTCSECARAYEMLRLEQEIYKRYDRELEITPALWTAIESRIQASSETGTGVRAASSRFRELFGLFAAMRLSPAAVAAIVLLAIGITVFVTRYSAVKQPPDDNRGGQVAVVDVPDGGPNGPADSSKQPGTASPSQNGSQGESQKDSITVAINRPPARPSIARKPTAQQLIREAEQKYLSAIAILSRDVERRKSSLDPQSVARFESALVVIDNTINETRQAARKNPNDPIALQYLLASYSKKVDVLREMARE